MAEKETQVEKQEIRDVKTAERTRRGRVFAPAVDIVETKNEYIQLKTPHYRGFLV